ncbi:ATP synthase subunit delta, chloroplastic [Rhodamnia argentea]|uniref:ATP synthase subunit delta, chloroplastic n=1 Tax=Rhodamnia argentea TaxID=178133 RepID=A0A8B8QP21_9MYRT|nr:ATP synthase subunit delta, chloroplastic [Rhodamnia argentea]
MHRGEFILFVCILTSQFSLHSFQMEILSSCLSSTLHLNKLPTSLHPSSSSSSSHHLHFISQRHPAAAPSFLSSSSLHSSSPSNSLHITSSNADGRPISPVTVHRKAATGYAAALMDAAQRNHSLGQVESDVHRLSLSLRSLQDGEIFSDPYASHADKGRVLKEISKQGRFHKHLVALLKMFIRKNQIEMVSEVLEEFKRIYRDMISGSEAVLSSQAVKMLNAASVRRSFTVDEIETSVSFVM